MGWQRWGRLYVEQGERVQAREAYRQAAKVVDLFGLQCYNCFQTAALVVAFLSAPFVSRRSRWRGLSAVTGLGSTLDSPVVIAGLGVAAFALNNRQPS
jgi:hypothetical protein